jgi:hypothetical protein
MATAEGTPSHHVNENRINNGNIKKRKINMRRSMASELVGVHDVAPQILWTQYLIKAQGYKLKDSVLNQDNMSAMLLETNGK